MAPPCPIPHVRGVATVVASPRRRGAQEGDVEGADPGAPGRGGARHGGPGRDDAWERGVLAEVAVDLMRREELDRAEDTEAWCLVT